MGMSKAMALCGECRHLLEESWSVRQLSRGSNQKVTCDNCHRRRYGGTYELGRIERQKAGRRPEEKRA